MAKISKTHHVTKKGTVKRNPQKRQHHIQKGKKYEVISNNLQGHVEWHSMKINEYIMMTKGDILVVDEVIGNYVVASMRSADSPTFHVEEFIKKTKLVN